MVVSSASSDWSIYLRLRFVSDSEEQGLVAEYMASRATGSPLEILEAGCGRAWTVPLAGVQYRLTGIDLDEPAPSDSPEAQLAQPVAVTSA